MKSSIVKRSIAIAAHKTSVSLEDGFWHALKAIATERGTNLSNLVAAVDVERRDGNLSSSLRLFVLEYYRNKLAEKMAAPKAQPDEKAPPEVKCAPGSI